MTKKILISACLLGIKCRYDGRHSKLLELSNLNIDWLSVCPEELGNLGTPRPPAEIQKNGKILTKSRKDVTEKFYLGAKKALKIGINNSCNITQCVNL